MESKSDSLGAIARHNIETSRYNIEAAKEMLAQTGGAVSSGATDVKVVRRVMAMRELKNEISIELRHAGHSGEIYEN